APRLPRAIRPRRRFPVRAAHAGGCARKRPPRPRPLATRVGGLSRGLFPHAAFHGFQAAAIELQQLRNMVVHPGGGSAAETRRSPGLTRYTRNISYVLHQIERDILVPPRANAEIAY